MKTTMRLLTALLVLSFVGAISLAESDDSDRGGGKGNWGNKCDRERKCRPRAKMGEKFCDEINATPEQRKQLRQIWETHRQAMKNWQKENGGKLRKARKALKEAKKSGDKDSIKAAKDKLRKIGKSRRELWENFREQLSEVLTKEQMEKMKKMQRRRRRRGGEQGPMHGGMGRKPYGELNLTDDQKARIKEMHKEAIEKAKSAKTRQEKREIFENLRRKINKEVLTKEQRKKAAKHFRNRRNRRRERFLKGLNATDEQKAEIEKIMKTARGKAEGKSPRERRKIMDAAREKIRKNVLTDKQRKKMCKMRIRGRKKFFDRIGLTKDQRLRANKIIAKAEKAAAGKSPEERRDIMQAARRKIHKNVLTDEQRDKVEKMMDRPRKGGRGEFGRRPGDERGPKHRKFKAHHRYRDGDRNKDDDEDDEDGEDD